MSSEHGARSVWFEHGPKIVGLIVLVLALAQQSSDALPGVFLVDGLNLSAGVSLARGEGFAFAHLPGAPDAATWLPGYPAVLSVIVRMWPTTPDNVTLIQLLNSLMIAGAAWALSASFRSFRFPPPFADMAILLAFWQPELLGLTTHPFAEPMFLALVFTGIGLIDRAPGDIRLHAVAGVLVTFGALTLIPGSVVLAAAVAAPMIRRKWRAAVAVLIPAAVLVGVWRGITDRGGNLVATTLGLARDYDPHGASFGSLLAGSWGWAATPVVIVALVLFAWGALSTARERPALVVGASGMAAFVFAWPHAPTRWLAATLPFVVPLAAVGLRRAWGWHRRVRAPVAILLVAWLVSYLPLLVAGTLRRSFMAEGREARSQYRMALESVKQELPPEAVVASDADAMVFLVADRAAVPVHALELESGVQVVCDRGASHLLWLGVGGERPARLQPPVSDSRLETLFSITNGPSLFAVRCSS